MKHIFLFYLAIGVILFSCKKNGIPPSSVAAFTIVNTAIGSSPIVANFSDTIIAYYSAGSINYGAYNLFSPVAGMRPLLLARKTDTTKPFLNGIFNLKTAAIYSLFICGDTTSIDTLFVQDNIPFHSFSDSVTGVRFVNLSKGSSPISVNIQGTSSPYISGLSYKQITDFSSLPATSTAIKTIFEFRDLASGNLLFTYSYTNAQFKNVTIAIKGIKGGTAGSSLGAMLINNY